MNDGECAEAEQQAGRQSSAWCDFALGVVGAVAGACLGYLLFRVLARQGFYAIVLPGALTGMGCGSLSGRRSIALGIGSAILGILAGILTEWRFAPFIQGRSLAFFMSHLHQLRQITQILILLGGAAAYWFGQGRRGGAWLRKKHISRGE